MLWCFSHSQVPIRPLAQEYPLLVPINFVPKKEGYVGAVVRGLIDSIIVWTIDELDSININSIEDYYGGP